MRSFTVNRTKHRDDRSYAASCANGQRPAGRRSVGGDTLYFRDKPIGRIRCGPQTGGLRRSDLYPFRNSALAGMSGPGHPRVSSGRRNHRPTSTLRQANDVAFPPSFGGCRVSQRTTPICAIALFRVKSRRAPAERQRRVRQRQSHGYFIVHDEGHLVRQRTGLPGARRCLLTLVGFALSGAICVPAPEDNAMNRSISHRPAGPGGVSILCATCIG
jgi:hypothetical protein